MKRTLFLVVFFAIAIAEVQIVRGQVIVAPTDNLQSLVNKDASGTTFILATGVHHDSVTSLKNGDTFTGQVGAIENGATVLTGWTQVTINSVTYWTTAGGTPLPSKRSSAQCETAYPGCFYSQNLYLDNVDYVHVISLANVTAGAWYYDFAGGDGGVVNNIYLANSENPSSHTVELSQYQYAFHTKTGGATGITIQGLIVEKYGASLQDGALSTTTSGWVVQNNELRLNHGYGIIALVGGDNIQVLNNFIHDNGQAGCGGPANNGTWRSNLIYHNNIDHVSAGFEAGTKWTGIGDVISYNTVHDNVNSPGLWSDDNAANTTYDHNLVYSNGWEGIRYEISDTGTITNNTVYNNGTSGYPGQTFQIHYTSSSHGTIRNNNITVASGQPGVLVDYSSARGGCGTGCAVPTGMDISANSITMTGTTQLMAGAGSSSGDPTSWQLPGLFHGNTYCVPAWPWTTTNWKSGIINIGSNISFATWQANGQDVNSTLTAGACPNAAVSAGGTTLTGIRISGSVFIR